MIEKDTVKLLRECDLGIKMGVSSISDMLPYAKSEKMKFYLSSSKSEHERLARECEALLEDYGDEGKNPNPLISGMSAMKSAMRLGLHPTDHNVADIMLDGCAMGIKSLSENLNKYTRAEEKAKDITKKLISMEDALARKMREFL